MPFCARTGLLSLRRPRHLGLELGSKGPCRGPWPWLGHRHHVHRQQKAILSLGAWGYLSRHAFQKGISG